MCNSFDKPKKLRRFAPPRRRQRLVLATAVGFPHDAKATDQTVGMRARALLLSDIEWCTCDSDDSDDDGLAPPLGDRHAAAHPQVAARAQAAREHRQRGASRLRRGASGRRGVSG